MIEVTCLTTPRVTQISPYLVGSCITSFYGGQGLLYDDAGEYTGRFHDLLLAKIAELGISMIRFPNNQPYYWNEPTFEPLPEGDSEPEWYHGAELPNSLDTDKFLGLCDMLGVRPLFTTTTVHPDQSTDHLAEDAELAAGWMRYCLERGRTDIIWEIGNEEYWLDAEPADKVAYYRQVLAAQLPALRAVRPNATIIAQGWASRHGHLVIDSEGRPIDGHIVANWNDMVVDEFGDDIDGLSIHTYYGANKMPGTFVFFGGESIDIPFTLAAVGEEPLLTVLATTTEYYNPGGLPVSMRLSVINDLGSELHPITLEVPIEAEFLQFEYPIDWITPGDYTFRIARVGWAGDQADLEFSTVTLDTGIGESSEIFLSRHDTWRWTFAAQAYLDGDLAWLNESYGKPLYVTEASARFNEYYAPPPQFAAGSGLAISQQIFYFARRGVKCRLQWSLSGNHSWGTASWEMIDNYVKMHTEDPTGNIYTDTSGRAWLCARYQVLKFISARLGDTLVESSTNSPRDGFRIYSHLPDTYTEYPVVDCLVTRAGSSYRVFFINTHHSEEARFTVAGLPDGYTGRLEGLAPAPGALTIFDAETFVEFDTHAAATESGSLTVDVPPGSIACATLNPPEQKSSHVYPNLRDVRISIVDRSTAKS